MSTNYIKSQCFKQVVLPNDMKNIYKMMRRILKCRLKQPKTWAILVLLIFFLLFVINILFVIRNNVTSKQTRLENPKSKHPRNIHIGETVEHSLCILIPFRDRFEELTEFVPRITHFLERQNIKHKIVVVNQVRYKMLFIPTNVRRK